MPRETSFWSWRSKRSLPQDKTPLVRRVIPKTESMRSMCQIWNILSTLGVSFTKQKTLFKEYNAFYIRYANQLGKQYSLDQNSVLLYTAEASNYTSLSKNFSIFSNNFICFSKCIWTETGSLILREKQTKVEQRKK